MTTLALLVTAGAYGVQQARRGIRVLAARAAQEGRATASGTAPGLTEISTLLAAMTQATRARNAPAFLAAFDSTDRVLTGTWTSRFANLTQLPLQEVRWQLHDPADEGVEPASPGMPAGARVLAVDLISTVPGFDQQRTPAGSWQDSPVHDTFPLTFAPVDGRWLVVADDDAAWPDQVDHTVRALPWAFGTASVLAREHVLVVGQDGDPAKLVPFAERLGTALADVRRMWPDLPSWNGQVVVYVLSDPEAVGQWLTTGSAGAGDLSGVTWLDGPPDQEPSAVAAPRLIVPADQVSADGPQFAAQLRYDLTHVARLRQDLAGGDLPWWLDEGSGDYTAYRGSGARVAVSAAIRAFGLGPSTLRALRSHTWTPVLDVHADASASDGSQAVTVRDSAFLACLYIATRYGEPALRALLSRASAARADDGAQAESAALAAVLHTDRQHLAAAVRAWAFTATTTAT